MKLEMRRRLHNDHITFHYDLLLITTSKKEEDFIDKFCQINICLEDVKVTGIIKTDEEIKPYIILTRTFDLENLYK